MGATTFGIIAFGITTLSTKGLHVTLSIITLCHYAECRVLFTIMLYAECHYAECHSAECRGALRWDQRYKPFTAVSQALTPPLHTDITNNYEWQTIQLVRPKQKSHYGCEKLYNIGPRWERLNKILCWIQWQNNLWRYTSEGQMAYTVKTFYCSKWCDKW